MMELNEETVKKALDKILMESTSKVNRDDYTRINFKIEEFQNSLNEAIKDLRKLQDSIPQPLKPLCKGRLDVVSSNLSEAQKTIVAAKEKLKQHKRNARQKQIEERKKRES